MSCNVLYLSSLRQGATAVRSSTAVHYPVASLEQTLAQRAPQVPRPKDTQQLLLTGSCCAQRTQWHALQLHLLWHAAPSVSWRGRSLTQTVRMSPVVVKEQNTPPGFLSVLDSWTKMKLSRGADSKQMQQNNSLQSNGSSQWHWMRCQQMNCLPVRTQLFALQTDVFLSPGSVFVLARPLPLWDVLSKLGNSAAKSGNMCACAGTHLSGNICFL